jgi:hypothetical protein
LGGPIAGTAFLLCLTASGCLRVHSLGGVNEGDAGDGGGVDADLQFPDAHRDGVSDLSPLDGADTIADMIGDPGDLACPDGTTTPASCDAGSCTCQPAVVSLAIAPDRPTLARGTTLQLMAVGTFASGITTDLTAQATWSSDTPAVATVSTSGVVTAVDNGTTLVHASAAGQQASTQVTVSVASLVTLEVLPADDTLAPGTSQQYIALGHFSDQSVQDLTRQVMWTSSAPQVANISNAAPSQGLCRANHSGTATVTAALFGITGQTGVTVSGPALVGIKIMPAGGNVSAGQTKQFRASGMFSNGGSQDITTQVVWMSSRPDVASISNQAGSQGLASGIQAGSSMISASSGDLSDAITLTVH